MNQSLSLISGGNILGLREDQHARGEAVQAVHDLGLAALGAQLDPLPLGLRLPDEAIAFLLFVEQEGIAFDERRGDALAPEQVLERLLHGGGAGARGAGDRDDGKFAGHGMSPCAGE